jgi:hypothetical protein
MQAEIPMRRVTAIRCYPSGERDDPDQRPASSLHSTEPASPAGRACIASCRRARPTGTDAAETRFQDYAMQAEIPMRRVTAIRCYPSGERDDPDHRPRLISP